jgi:hypothetical protein
MGDNNKKYTKYKIFIQFFVFFIFYSCTGTDLITDTDSISLPFSYELYLNYSSTSKNLSSQGFAVYDNYAFIMYNSGICDVYDLETKLFVNRLLLGSYMASNHANVADFGVEYPEGNTEFPAIYISECVANTQRRCFVESITTSNSKLIQTISVNSEKVGSGGMNYTIDRENKLLYVLCRAFVNADYFIFTVFHLPLLSDGKNVILTDNDIVDQYTVSAYPVSQGAFIYRGYMYFLQGISGKSKRALFIIDLATHQTISIIDLTTLNLEPEDLYIYKDFLLINYNSGKIYSFKNVLNL